MTTTAPYSPPRESLPDYAPLLAARHEAHRAELAAIIDELPLDRGDRVLDVPCGDGFYLPYLAERVGEAGDVTAADIAPAYLRRARRVSNGAASTVRHVAADAFALPFDSATFDLVWCAHSLISLPDPIAALREMKRVTRAGGTIAVLENDGLHDLLLPWPADLELAVHDALRAAMARRLGSAGKMYAARHLQELFHAAGLETFERRTSAIDRTAPLPDADREFLRHYFDWLARQVDRILDERQRVRLHALIDPSSPAYLPDSNEFEMTSLDVVMLGRA
ncbi:MAG: methyltransferase domain-containing protein [Planctomycetaceae bacterium]